MQVAWVRVDTQTILTIHKAVITRSHRIGLSHTDMWTWNLHIRNVKETDRGFYMCQINTDPMMSQVTTTSKSYCIHTIRQYPQGITHIFLLFF